MGFLKLDKQQRDIYCKLSRKRVPTNMGKKQHTLSIILKGSIAIPLCIQKAKVWQNPKLLAPMTTNKHLVITLLQTPAAVLLSAFSNSLPSFICNKNLTGCMSLSQIFSFIYLIAIIMYVCMLSEYKRHCKIANMCSIT